MVELLDSGGMSSDESDYEDSTGNKTFVVRHKHWRSDQVTELLKFIDANRDRYSIYGNAAAGTPPRHRERRDGTAPSKQKAIRHLPRNFYRASFYQSLSVTEREALDAKDTYALSTVEALCS